MNFVANRCFNRLKRVKPCPMFFRPVVLALSAACCLRAAAPAEAPYLTYNPLPLGTPDRPLLLRTYLPDPDLDPAVFAHHGQGDRSPRYQPTRGEDVPGEYQPIKGVPAAIGVNHGPGFSYVFDTTEGRVLYAWQGGFVDLYPYWGDQQSGGRSSNDYVPKLVGTLFYKAAGKHPIEVNGRSVSDLGPVRYVGYDLKDHQPTFIVKFGDRTIRLRVRAGGKEPVVKFEIAAEPAAKLSYRSEDSRYGVKQEAGANGTLNVTLTGTAFGTFAGYPRRSNITAASAEAGDTLSKNYGCVVCHTSDGSLSHGPTWAGLFDTERALVDGTKVKVDDAYILESIKNPNAKIAQGFAPNFMPPYPMMKDVEYESLVLFIKSLKQPD